MKYVKKLLKRLSEGLIRDKKNSQLAKRKENKQRNLRSIFNEGR